ncbi:methylmalonyl-CoA mutase [Trujillonella endophytica]|uniref:Methylmalonyl-CoA mutase, C-terminal domain n=1 Tax=Trujillonella endophytica TaxID=673521 RepID=A0A1H8RQ74_9ACTN|nr:methylmalonyl-CoA mutase [Trujillella endophytica]SEO68729.1 methylmalonyl-CoA mutase, C-terminal domain [Trujillella endophytica]
MDAERLRVVVAEPAAGSPAGEALAAIALARVLRDAGAEVVHTGGGGSPAQLAATLVQEDADALGLAGGSARLLGEVLARAAEQGADDVAGFLLGGADGGTGGGLPDGARVFPAGTPPDDVVAWLRAVGGGR